MKVGVIGSINVDLVYELTKPLALGETRFAHSYDVLDGGKGANQAVILKALHDNTVFLGAIGPDAMGVKAEKSLHEKGLDRDIVMSKEATGLALIQLTHGENQIIVFPGANLTLSQDMIDTFFDHHPDMEILVAQLETNPDIVYYALEKAHAKKIKTVLNPAPAPKNFSTDYLSFIDYLVPNEHEILAIFGNVPIDEVCWEYPEKVIVTLGSQGVKYATKDKLNRIPAKKIEVVDTTGAGDSFIAGFVSGLAKKYTLEKAIHEGIRVASLTCQRLGAQGAYSELRGENQ